MSFNNKTIIFSGLIVIAVCGLFLNYQEISLAIVSGLLGYIAKDPQIINSGEESIGDGSDSEVA